MNVLVGLIAVIWGILTGIMAIYKNEIWDEIYKKLK